MGSLLLEEMLRYFGLLAVLQVLGWQSIVSWPGDILRCWRRLQGRNARLLCKSSLLNIAGDYIAISLVFFPPNHSLLEALTFRIFNSRRFEKNFLAFCDKHFWRVIMTRYWYLGYTEPAPEYDLWCSENKGTSGDSEVAHGWASQWWSPRLGVSLL